MCCAGICALSVVPLALEEGFTSFLTLAAIITTFWSLIAIGILGWALNAYVGLSTSTFIAREREQQNWQLLKLTTLRVETIIGAKMVGLLYHLRLPLFGLVLLRGAVSVLAVVTIGGIATAMAQSGEPLFADEIVVIAWLTIISGAVLFNVYMFAEMIIALLYNSSLGVLASSFARTSANAVALAVVLQFVLWMMVYMPLQQIAVPLLMTSLLIALPTEFATEGVAVATVFAWVLMPFLYQITIGILAFSLAAEQARKINE